MKKYFLLLFLSISFFASAQKSLNDYQYVIVPVKFEFLKEENKYRLNTITKFNLQKIGFIAFYENENLPQEAKDRCNLLFATVEEESGFLMTRLALVLKDCQNRIVFKSELGKSRSKEYKIAYPEALNDAFESLFNYGYKYNGKNISTVTSIQKTETPKSSPQIDETKDYLFAQPIPNGYQLVDKTPKVVLKIYKTSQPDYFTAQSETINGAVIKKNGEWILEYYKDDKPVSEKLLIKF
ncbi:hypothetical protein [uncultured Flavobacterium sp.]|uniref:hypothetical protein n=1 Tax=uncultured Flavobacterium sp. TaxID=165435 RepID=UPI0025CFC6F6|nr:hypothetical protein [uncultured Flavobacterium sp.]